MVAITGVSAAASLGEIRGIIAGQATMQLQWRRGLAATWTSVNPILLDGEVGYETDTNKFKVGDSVTSWSSLSYYETALLARANHTGTQTASTISDFDTEVSNNSAVAANTAKTSNANHTGDVTGSTALTIALGITHAWTAQQNSATNALTDAANISWDLDASQRASVTLTDNRTLDNPTNLVDGGTYTLIVTQDATGTRTLAYGSAYKWPGGSAPTLSTAANAVDILEFSSDGTNMYGNFRLAYA